jgi:hypothetical protein
MKKKTQNLYLFFLLLIIVLGGIFFMYFKFTGQKEGFFWGKSANRAYYEENKVKMQEEIDNRQPEPPPIDYNTVKGDWLKPEKSKSKTEPPCEGTSLVEKKLGYICEKRDINKLGGLDWNEGTIDLNKCKQMEVKYSDKTGKLVCK